MSGKNFFGTFKKVKRKPQFITFKERLGKRFTFSSDVQLSNDDFDTIIYIIIICINQLDLNNLGYGQKIAKNIVECIPSVCACRVNGGIDGKNWLIELSDSTHL